MGFFKKIGHRLQRAKRIGHRMAHSSAIGLRKIGHTLGRVAEVAPKIGGALSTIGAVTGFAPLTAAGAAIGTTGALAGKAGALSTTVGRGIGMAADGNFKGAGLEAAKAKSQHEGLFK
jgi:hypothetical protein